MTASDPYAANIKARAERWAEGVAALSVLAGMRSCAAGLQAILSTDDPMLHTVLFSGVVVNYARAFEEVKDRATDTSRRFSTRKLPLPFDKDLHEAMLSLRNEQIAHAGHVMNDYDLTFMIASAEIESTQADGTVKREVKRHIVGTRARASLACGPITTERHGALMQHIKALETEAGQRLAVAIVEHDAASIFRLEQQVKEGIYARPLNVKQFAIQGGGVAIMGEEDLAFSLAKAPEALPLAFTVMQYNVVERDGSFSLNGSSTVE